MAMDGVVSESNVIIIGGGASGLSAAGALARRGIETVILEEDAALGGTWSRRYDRLHFTPSAVFQGSRTFRYRAAIRPISHETTSSPTSMITRATSG